MRGRKQKKTLDDIVVPPIELPKSPFFEVLESFGRDEVIDIAINAASTGVLEGLLDHQAFGPMEQKTQDILLSGVGPIIGKVGFFPAHIYDAVKHYHALPEDQRKPFSTYLKQAFKEGGKNLIENITIQDPCYAGLMYAGLTLFPETPPLILSIAASVISVIGLSAGEVAVKETLYNIRQGKLRHAGFRKDSYHEARFKLGKEEHQPQEVIEKISREFRLDEHFVGSYRDKYFPTNLHKYNGREPQLRFRKIDVPDGSSDRLVSITYARARKLSEEKGEQFCYYLKKKDNFFYKFKQKIMPWTPQEIQNERVREVVQKAILGDESAEINYRRTSARRPELLCTTDRVVEHSHKPFYVIELKSRNNVPLLKESMYFVMRNFHVIETISEKNELAGCPF